jgi:predicted O-methyltransferase YrrM
MLFGPKIIEERDSKFSGRIKVVASFGYKYIATGILTQSGGLVREVWEGTLKKFGRKQKTWLVLGLAGGTIAKYVSDKLEPKKIVGVEIDPIMVELGRKYLDLNNIPSLEIITKDAKQFVNSASDHYDYILVDMYFGDQLPAFVYSDSFLKKLKKIGTTVIFNHLFYDSGKQAKAEELVQKLKDIFPEVVLARKLTNLLVICGPKAI